jgi:SLT domain-containing protein
MWDSNAAAGHPSKGLMQVIDPTFNKFRDPRASNNIFDPLANVLASMNYALNRYGSLPAAYDRAGGYRLGGALNPGQFAYNETGEPEAILNTQQWNALYRNANQFGAEGGLENLVRTIVQEVQPMFGAIHVTTTPQATAQDIIDEATFHARVARRKGIYQ